MALNRQPPLGNISQTMSRMGRGGDTTLVHMNPAEVRGLSSLGKLSYNPVTGLPEAFAFLPAIAAMFAGGLGLSTAGTAGLIGGASLIENKSRTGDWNLGKTAMNMLMGMGMQQVTKGFMSDKFMEGFTNIDTPLRDIAGGTTGLTTGGGPSGPDEIPWLGSVGENIAGTIGVSPEVARGGLAGLGTGLATSMLTEESPEMPSIPRRRSPSSGFGEQRYTQEDIEATEEERLAGMPFKGPGVYETVGLTEDVYPGTGFPNLMAAEGGSIDSDYEGYVGGDGHGMEDNQMFNIKGGGLAALSPKEYVVPADVMASMGNGNPDDGAKAMDGFISKVRKEKYGRDKQPPEMDARKQLQKLA